MILTAIRTSDDLRSRDVRARSQEPTAYDGPNKPMERAGHTRLVASWSADAPPTATWSVDHRTA